MIINTRKKPQGYEYHGNWKDGLRDGKNGKCFYYNDSFYIGDWQQDLNNELINATRQDDNSPDIDDEEETKM